MGHTADLNHPLDAILAELLAERKRLDDALDDALLQFAVYEEQFNARLHTAPDELRPMMFAERTEVEEMLGIADIVERLDRLRERILDVQAQAEADRF